MSLRYSSCVVLLSLIVGCRTPTGRVNSSGEWMQLRKSIEQTRRDSKAETVVIAFSADWNAVAGPLFRRELGSPQVMEFLAKRSIEAFMTDLSTTNSLGWSAIDAYGAEAVPLSIAIWRRGHSPRFVRPYPVTAEAIVAVLAQSIQ